MKHLSGVMGIALLVASVSVVGRAEDPKSEFFTTKEGIKIHYLTLGNEGSWVFLIHGATDSAKRMWFNTGIAPALAKNHRVVAMDCRNHGESGTGEGGSMGDDAIQLMDHLGIKTAHIHGYSMGGGVTGQLLGAHPEKFITAGFGGSGLSETNPEEAAKARAKDEEARAKGGSAAQNPSGAPARGRGGARAGARRGAAGGAADAASGAAAPRGARRGGGAGGQRAPIDLAKLDVPILFVNGSLDSPYSRSSRALREAKVAENIVLEGKTHFTAIMVGGPMPPEYVDGIVKFINGHDKK